MHFRTLTRSKLARAAVVLGVVATAVVATADPALAAVPLTITPATGPAGSATGPTVAINTTTSVFSGTPAVSFQLAGTPVPASPQTLVNPPTSLNACWPSYAAGAAPTTALAAGVVISSSVVRYSPTRLYVKVPSLPIIGTPAAKYHVCVYAGTDPWVSVASPGSPLVASLASGYSASPAATITSVSPVSGPAKGGTPIVVTGTNLAAATVTLGGVPMTPTIATDGLSFTAVTPPHAADGQPVTLAVTTTGGTVNKAGAFTYSNGIIVSPNYVPRYSVATGQYIEVQGVGFSSLNVLATTGSTPDSANAHVYLSRGTYNDATVAGHKTNPQLSECTDVLVMNDGLLICKIGLLPSLPSAIRTVTDGEIPTGALSTLTSPTANFTQDDVGLAITGTSAAAGSTAGSTTIAAVLSPTTVTLSTAGTAGLLTTTIIASTRAIAAATTLTTGGVTVLTDTGATGKFTTADIGRTLNSTGLFITSIQDPDNAVLSGPMVGADLAAAAATLKNVIPDGAYVVTVVNDGRMNASAINPNFNKSVVSSGATFTVGDYLS